MKHRKKIFWMIIFVPLLLVVPVNLVIARYARGEIRRAREQKIQENETYVNSFCASLENELSSIDTYIRLLTTGVPEYAQMLGFSDDDEPGFWNAESQLSQEIKMFQVANSFVKSITIYFNRPDVVFNRDSFDVREKPENLRVFTELLKEEEQARELSVGGDWLYIPVDGRVYLGFCRRSEKAAVLATVSLSEILADLAQERQETEAQIACFFNGKELLTHMFGALPVQEESSDVRTLPNGRTYTDCRRTLLDLNVSFGMLLDVKDIDSGISRFARILRILAALSFLVGPAISLFFYRMVDRPLSRLTEAMEHIRAGDASYRIPIRPKRFRTEFDELNGDFNTMLNELEQSQKALYQKEIDAQRVQLRYLNQQIRPHFILNALNNIYTCEEGEIALVRKMVMYLTRYFRYLVNLNSDYVYLYDEMEFVKTYLDIQKIRYPDRFVYFTEWEEDIGEAMIPAVVLQTFVENSIKYSFEKDRVTYIFVLGRKQGDDRLLLTIADTGRGFDQEILEKIRVFLENHRYREDLGVGIQNVVERLDLLYGDRYEISMKNGDDGGARVEIILPLKYSEEMKDD